MTTPDLAPPLQTSTPHQREDVWLLRMIWSATGPKPGGSSVASSFEPGALRTQSRDLTTRPLRPPQSEEKQFRSGGNGKKRNIWPRVSILHCTNANFEVCNQIIFGVLLQFF
ncbi:hypothetical protein AVEN_96265-1 [Araneus ventricosus]|uniref:Uncharacterized protein n=1 Tax=Araneus ventricosus TaxID=182803 RepID=A0A4Y2H4H2_ARAVE|nr:hypothetical protein AVEN_96265-1 [Araneus ventricosus]